jgi:hypothetical protein
MEKIALTLFMDHKKAIDILLNLREKNTTLTHEEKEAISTAIGIFSWTSLAKNRFKNNKEKELS